MSKYKQYLELIYKREELREQKKLNINSSILEEIDEIKEEILYGGKNGKVMILDGENILKRLQQMIEFNVKIHFFADKKMTISDFQNQEKKVMNLIIKNTVVRNEDINQVCSDEKLFIDRLVLYTDKKIDCFLDTSIIQDTCDMLTELIHKTI
ncbi:hypothetical protein [Alcanivorax sp.]|uniref:hypothetical protein n=1 Tax=Alcanivorax sp. TaxID=1872427 RepID=UPI0025C12F46|nr:hypothetical protein [Alcanivorax sp.]